MLFAPAQAEVTFDGSIGPNLPGTVRSGNFEVSEADGQLSGNNLFHSFQTLNVNTGETATFSHTTGGVQNIIGRVTGDSATQIQGGVAVRQDLGGPQVPTAAVLWVLNPNGILIGDGAAFDANSSFRLSTANQLDFDNGDSFFSHDVTQTSTLSIANPTKFGFLVDDTLPPSVTPSGISIRIDDPGNANVPLFLADMTLVGTSKSASQPGISIQGDLASSNVGGIVAPADSSQIQAFRLSAYGLGAGEFVDVVTPPDFSQQSGGSAIQISDSNIFSTDNGFPVASGITLGGGSVQIDNSYIQTSSIGASTDIAFSAVGNVAISDSSVNTLTLTATDAGGLEISAGGLSMQGSLVGSQVPDLGFAFGNSGDVSLAATTIVAETSLVLSRGLNTAGTLPTVTVSAGTGGLSFTDSSVLNTSVTTGAGGDIVISSGGDIAMSASSLTPSVQNNTAGSLDSGDIRITADGNLAITGPYELTSDASATGNAGDITVSGASVDLVDVAIASGITTASNFLTATGAGGDIVIQSGGDIGLRTVSGNQTIQTNTAGATDSGQIRIQSGGDVAMTGSYQLTTRTQGSGDAGAIAVTGDDITFEGSHQLVSVTTSSGSAGAITMTGTNIDLAGDGGRLALSSSTLGSGSAGQIDLTAQERLGLSVVELSTVGGDGAAGRINLSGADVTLNDARLSTATISDDAADSPAAIVVEADSSLSVTGGLVQSNTADAAPAGRIQMTSGGSFTLTDVDIQSASLASGTAGDITLTAENGLTLQGENATVLTNAEGSSDAGNVLLQAANVQILDQATIQTTSTGTGDAGNIRVQGGRVYTDSGRIESASANAGGGNIELFARDVILDGDSEAQRRVFIIADSFSSDASGNGGSITLGDPQAPAELVVVRNSALTASAQQGDGGRININSLNFIRDTESLFLVTSESGEPGALEINAPERNISAAIVELNVPRLDQTDLIQDLCARDSGERSSLTIVPVGDAGQTPDSYFPSAAPAAATSSGQGAGTQGLTLNQDLLALAPMGCLP